jgi:elongation of very long chain fatty acids protein 6
MLPEYSNVISTKGIHASVCERQNKNRIYGAGLLIMAWSKLFELGDTLFIVLRKQKLIFLHWYHHITVMMYTWAVYEHNDPSLPLFMVINVFIHSLMYSYYSAKAMRFRVPTSIAMVVTTLQLLQMVVGVTVNVYSYFVRLSGNACDRSDKEIYGALAMYASYLVLFGNFFYQTYMAEKPGRPGISGAEKPKTQKKVQ